MFSDLFLSSNMPRCRVYDKVTHHMHICGTDSHDSGYLDDKKRFCYYNFQNCCGSSYDNENADYILMFSTLLFDKKGNEIFEGDIIQYGGLFEMEVCHDEYMCFYLRDMISGTVFDISSRSEDYEIVSNVYCPKYCNFNF